MVDRADSLREQAGMPIADAEDEAPDPNTLRLHGDGGHRGDRLEAVAITALRRSLLEMIGDREPIEAALVREPPEATHLGQRTAEVAKVDPEPNTRCRSTDPQTLPACSFRWRARRLARPSWSRRRSPRRRMRRGDRSRGRR